MDMDVISVEDKLTPKQRARVLRLLRGGGVIVFPTDTSYGIGGNACSASVERRIAQLKHRSLSHRFPIVVAHQRMAKRLAHFTRPTHSLAKKYWPGALTLVVKSRLHGCMHHPRTIAVRIPNHPMLLDLLRCSHLPLVATSANLHGKPPVYSLRSFQCQFKSQKFLPDLFLNVGSLPQRSSSTIVDTTTRPPRLLRHGPVRIPQPLLTTH